MRTILRFVFVTALWAAPLLACRGPEYPNCENDSQCQRDGRHEFCVQRHCQQCRADGDCPAGQHCADNRCVAPPQAQCDEQRPCAEGSDCVQGRCVAASTGPVGARSDDGGQCSFAEVHFAFDSYTLDPSSQTALQSTAECLRREGTTHYVLLGRTDPRGTTEYNLALGERRARSVQRYLVALGIAEPRLAVSSMGSEGASGSDEASYERDRRVDPTRRDAPAAADAGAAHPSH